MVAKAQPSTSPNRTHPFTRVLEQLACPACHGGLRLQRESLVCGGCGRVYSIIDGIPVLISDRIDLTSRE